MSASKVADVVEVVEETVETLERIPKVRLNGTTKAQQILILATTAGVAAAVAGVVVGKIVAKRQALKYEDIITHEVNEARAFYQRVNKPPMEEVAESMNLGVQEEEQLDQAVQALKGYQGAIGKVPYNKPEIIPVQVEPPPTVQVTNVFVEGQAMNRDDFDYEAEIAQRSEDNPYIISYDEFVQGEKEYEQTGLRWYEGDDTLTDDKDVPIPATTVDEIVGDENLQKFGHGSRDPRIVYVRNDKMEVDFEVAKNDSSFQSAVLGFQHSDRPGSRKVPRFRGDDG
jgi:hypothetical protein